MMIYLRSIAGLVLCASLMLGACNQGEEDENTGSDTGGAPSGIDAPGTTPGATDTHAVDTTAPPQAMSDAAILAKLKEVNEAEVAVGTLAQEKGTNKKVRAYGKMLADEHGKMIRDVESLAAKLGITPQPEDRDREEIQQAMRTLQSTPQGQAFDSVFIAHELNAHMKTMDRLNTMSSQVRSRDLGVLISNAIPHIVKHLEQAKELQGEIERR